MRKVLSEFNELLKGNQTFAIACIEDRTEWIISAKENVDEFINGIVNACNDAYGINAEEEEKECSVQTAETFDYGYSLEVGISIPGENNKEVLRIIYLYHANKF